MKLKKFFDQKTNTLSDEAKLAIYQQFLEKRQKKTSRNLFKRFAIATKTTVYGVLIATVTIGLFGFISNDPYTTSIFGNKGFNISSTTSPTYRANANSIGMIQQFHGGYTMRDEEGNKLETNIIDDKSLIILNDGAVIQAELNGNIARVTGPAKIKLHKTTGQTFLMEIIEGNFVEVDNQNEKNQLQIKKNNLTITKSNTAKKMKIQIREEETGETTVKNVGNEGDSINISDQDQGEETEINAQHQITINKEETTIDQEKVIAIIENTQLQEEDELETLIALLQNSDESDQSQTESGTTQTGTETTITTNTLNNNQLEELEDALHAKFVYYDLANIIRSIQLNNPGEYNIALTNFASRIENIAKIVAVPIDTSKITPKDIQKNIQILLTQIPIQYTNIPTSTTNNLLVLHGWTETLQSTENITKVGLDPTKQYTAEQLVREVANAQAKHRLLIPR